MPVRKSNAEWKGDLQNGSGTITVGADKFSQDYTFSSRFEQGSGTNPEELIAAAHAGCYSMALAHALEEKGSVPESVRTEASVDIEKSGDGFSITTIILKTQVKASGIEEQAFQETAAEARDNCPVSQALRGAEIKLEACLE